MGFAWGPFLEDALCDKEEPMSNLLTREPRTLTPQTPVLEPFRMMRELMRWDPFRDNLLALDTQTFMPSFEVKETPSAYVFKADLPGIKEEDLDIQLLGNRLTIGGKRETDKKEENETWHLIERSYGSFSRSSPFRKRLRRTRWTPI